MELLVVRHAEAEEPQDATAAGRRDLQRQLTARGRRRMERGVAGLLALSLDCELVLHSPWTRATETAALLAPLASGETRALPALARVPDGRLLAELARLAARHEGGETRLALVGHQPWLGELVAWLTIGEREKGSALALGKGSVAWLSGRPAPGGMELRALLPARVLRKLG
jgi:phosphohistidine phosphatase